MAERDHYQVLGVPPDASMHDIRRAYRRLARQHHPDISHHPEDDDQFVALTAAYEVLHDPDRRASYDHAQHLADPRARPRQQEAPRWAEGGWAPGWHADRARPIRGGDRRAILELSVHEAEELARRAITVRVDGLTIALPRGTRAGQGIRVVGAGERGSLGGPPGDLLLTLEMPSRTTAIGASLFDALFSPAQPTVFIRYSRGRF